MKEQPTRQRPLRLEQALIYRRILPSIVLIRTTSGEGEGSGTGVVINRDGSILTAHHVVAGSTEIRVSFADGTEANGIVVAADPTRTSPFCRPTGRRR